MSKYNKYIMNVFFHDGNSATYDTIPVICESKQHVDDLLARNMQTYPGNFELFNYDFNTDDIKKYGYLVQTVEEFFESAYQ